MNHSISPAQQPDRPQVETEPILWVVPFISGVAAKTQIIVRCAGSPDYLSITEAEYRALCELRQNPCTISEFLGRHLSGSHGLDFRGAINLLLRLHQEKFIAHHDGRIAVRLNEYAGTPSGHAEGSIGKIFGALTSVLDIPLIRYHASEIHPAARIFGRSLISPLTTIVLCIATLCLSILVSLGNKITPSVLTAQIGAPEILLLKISCAFSLASSVLAMIQMAALSGAGSSFVGGSMRITGLCVLRLAVHDNDILMQSKSAIVRYHLVSIVIPWLLAFAFWGIKGGNSLSTFTGQLAVAFAMIGVFSICPLWRSPVIKTAEGWLASLDILDRANAHLAGGLLSSLLHPKRTKEKNSYEYTRHNIIVASSCLSLVWLYVVGLFFADVLLAAATELWVHAHTLLNKPMRGTSAALMLAVLIIAMLMPFLRFVAIPLQNLAAVGRLPISRGRMGLGA
ncbi:MAG: hypothetical protein HQK54_08690 [Oligoflexales bacterium]|nr:hypothetical protein [Oligoflexales bacterium]